MVRTIVKPAKNSLTIKLPDNFVGKTIEVIAFEIEQDARDKSTASEKEKRMDAINNALDKHRIDLSDFKFDRGEANDYE